MSDNQTDIEFPVVPERAQWFVHDRFGMFIHWGIYSAIARYGRGGLAEWSKSLDQISEEHYQQYFDTFEPDLYDPREWARMAKAAGMKYAVITTKHHDGFCLWDTQLTDYKAPNTPAGRDLIRPWVEAFRAEGLRVGFYYSLIDWHHPHFPVDGLHPRREDTALREEKRDMAIYREYLSGQVRELLTNYGPIDVLWFDFSYPGMDWGWARGKGHEDWQSEQIVELVRELMPDVLLNNRLDLPEAADFITPEQVQPRSWLTVNGKRVTWEACQTLNGSWGYDRDNTNWKSPDLLIRMLIESVSNGGNMLLNVGPTARGEIDVHARAILQEVGEWMKHHGKAIYGTTASRFTPPPDSRYTQRGDRLYLHLFSWPMGHIFLPGLANKVKYARFMNDNSALHFESGVRAGSHTTPTDLAEDVLTLELPAQRPDVILPVVELILQDA
ncbi:alpha-L-fucosidase [Dictyobacter aurantiacus]|uniref:alpha-L-fucosidase n=1 Tax=Dictyobacter aurantiacus TaxID=1936993 RepID=A0A401Z8V4_9CHLR|nr:alpha-L-fucosidase [Dictyobacter aurantiacus]GCE03294.1 alpha-L-fucosidase [Dictyobacter aurantiacus]